MHIALLCNPVC